MLLLKIILVYVIANYPRWCFIENLKAISNNKKIVELQKFRPIIQWWQKFFHLLLLGLVFVYILPFFITSTEIAELELYWRDSGNKLLLYLNPPFWATVIISLCVIVLASFRPHMKKANLISLISSLGTSIAIVFSIIMSYTVATIPETKIELENIFANYKSEATNILQRIDRGNYWLNEFKYSELAIGLTQEEIRKLLTHEIKIFSNLKDQINSKKIFFKVNQNSSSKLYDEGFSVGYSILNLPRFVSNNSYKNNANLIHDKIIETKSSIKINKERLLNIEAEYNRKLAKVHKDIRINETSSILAELLGASIIPSGGFFIDGLVKGLITAISENLIKNSVEEVRVKLYTGLKKLLRRHLRNHFYVSERDRFRYASRYDKKLLEQLQNEREKKHIEALKQQKKMRQIRDKSRRRSGRGR